MGWYRKYPMSLSIYLLVIIGIVFILQLAFPLITPLFYFDPARALAEPWLFVTSMFMHGGLTHLFFNGYALFMFGSILESRVRQKDYLIIYFGAGLIGGLAYYITYLLGVIPPIPALGASGAIYGLLGAVAVLLPDLRIFMWFFPMKMKYAAMLWVAIEFLGTFDISSGIASAAHLGGLLFGIAFAWTLKKKASSTYHPPSEWEVQETNSSDNW